MSSPREAELVRQLQAREEELRQANAKIALLQQKIDALVRRIFGSKSEKLDPRQMQLLLQLTLPVATDRSTRNAGLPTFPWSKK